MVVEQPSNRATAPPRPSVAEDEDHHLQCERLRRFLAFMLPIALAFDGVYIATALWLKSVALAGGAFAVALYAMATAFAQRRLRRGRKDEAALLTGAALLAMVAIGAVFLHFLLAALVVIPLAGVALVLPHADRAQLRGYLLATLVIVCEVVVVDGLAEPLFPQPPSWFQKTVQSSAIVIAVALTIRLLWVDHERLRNLLWASRESLRAAQTANAAKDAFLVAATHDLRTPVATLQLQAQSLVQGPLSQKVHDARLQERIARIDRQSRRLGQLVDGLLDVSQIASGRLDLASGRFDLVALVRESIARLEHEIARSDSDVRLLAPECLEIDGDRNRVGQIVVNLVGNAVKYGAGKPIEVSVCRDGAAVELVVRDEGIGIPQDALGRVFEPFERGPDAENYSGLGVGLWLVRELVRMMHGTVSVASRVGEGSVFTVRLPAGA